MARVAVDRVPSSDFARALACAALLSISSSVGGCAADVTLEDDDGGRSSGAGDGDGDGDGVGDADGGGAGTASSGTGSSPEEELAAAQAACTDFYYSCNGLETPMPVGLTDCNDLTTLPECAHFLTDLYRCAAQPGGTRYDACDFELHDRCQEQYGIAFYYCMNPYVCGANGGPECAFMTASECSCVETCDQGHVAQMDCKDRPGGGGDDCDCYFDDELVGQCSNDYHASCQVYRSCCETLLR